VELTEEYAQKEGLGVDLDGFEKELSAQRERARNARQDVDSMHVQNTTLREIKEDSRFIGYGDHTSSSVVTVLIKDNERIDSAKTGEEVLLMLDQTPFYAESGGQVADTGILQNDHALLRVKDVQKAPNGQNLHTVIVEQGQVNIGDRFEAQIDSERRSHAQRNHTATHLLHQALKDVLGAHVNQAGSLVAPDRLRFDFSHFGKITEEELEQIETIVNEKIWASISVNTMEKGLEEAKAMGAMALFGEKYGDIVRVVQVGDYSLELCGGCHVRNTAEIGLFKIVSEAGIGAGTRRIEAVTGKFAFNMLNKRLKDMQAIAAGLKTNLDGIPEKIHTLREQIHALEKENESLTAKLGNKQVSDLVQNVQHIGGVPVLAHRVDGIDMNGLRAMVDQLKNSLESGIMVLAAVQDEKVNIVCGVTKDLIDKGFHAGKLVKEVATRCGGGGGGRPDMAQAGGKNPSELDKALAFVPEWVEGILSHR
ncbi:MAG: alanine--tRNA ligase, partial [Tuberibacillus sp.]